MKNSISYILIGLAMIISAAAMADVNSNTDFNPFPQMEQDLNNTDNQPEAVNQQNDDWPPANTQFNGEAPHG